VYALTVKGAKPKLTRAEESERSGCNPDPTAPRPVTNMGPMFSCKNITMAELAQEVQRQAAAYIAHPIVDETGLTGGWDFLIGWTPRAMLRGRRRPIPTNRQLRTPIRRTRTASPRSRQSNAAYVFPVSLIPGGASSQRAFPTLSRNAVAES
jgi:uncharacterized protein (TIGR03435 family)